MKKKNKVIILVSMLTTISLAAILYFTLPRIDVKASNERIEQNKSAVKQNKKNSNKVADSSFVAKMSVKSKIKDIYIYDNASEATLFNKGAGIQEDISTGFEEKDYTYIKGHVETSFKDLDKLVINDVIEITLTNQKILKYQVINIREEKYLNNNEIDRTKRNTCVSRLVSSSTFALPIFRLKQLRIVSQLAIAIRLYKP